MGVDFDNLQIPLQMAQILMHQFSEHELRGLMKEVVREIIREEIQSALTNFNNPTATSDEEYLTVDQVCKLLQVSKPTLNSNTKNGIINAYRFGRSVRYLKSEIAASMQQVRNKNYKK